jgi:hypothetical protein
MGAVGSDFNGLIMLTLLVILIFPQGSMSTVLSSPINALLMRMLTFGWHLNKNGTADGALLVDGGVARPAIALMTAVAATKPTTTEVAVVLLTRITLPPPTTSSAA